MKKLLIPFLLLPLFSSNALVANPQTTYLNFDMQEEEVRSERLNELKDAVRRTVSEEESIKFVHYFIPESDQVIVVDLREECEEMLEYWADGFLGDFNQTYLKLEENENECLREAMEALCVWIDDSEYQINLNNLVTLQEIVEREFAENLKQRYVCFQIADDNLQNDQFVNHFLQHTLNYSDYHVRLQYLSNKETPTTVFFLLDTISPKENSDHKLQLHNYATRQASDSNIPCSIYAFQRSHLAIPKQVSLNELYDSLLCDCSITTGVSYEWGGNEPSKYNSYIEVKAKDDKGNFLRGTVERTGDRNKISSDYGYDDQKRERDDQRRGRADN